MKTKYYSNQSEPHIFGKCCLDAAKNLITNKGDRVVSRIGRTIVFSPAMILEGLKFSKEELADINIDRDELEAMAKRLKLIK